MDGFTFQRDRVVRRDAAEKVTGVAQFTFDLAMDGMLHAKALRSPHAHARIRAIHTADAESLPGVFAVVTGADIKHLKWPFHGVFIWDQPIIAIDKVRCVGDIVAAVAAIDEPTAHAALELIRVDYEILPALMSIDAALAADAPVLFEVPSHGIVPKVGVMATSVVEPQKNVLYDFGYKTGDYDAVAAKAAHIFTDTFTFSAINHFHLEPHVNIARVAGRRIDLWSCNQDPFQIRSDLARLFERPVTDFCVHATYIGGGFGGKSYTKWEPLTVLLAMKAGGRPVRFAFCLDESIVTLTKHAARMKLTTAVDAEGILMARRSLILLDAGAYADASAMTAIKSGYRVTGPYRWQAVDTLSRSVRTTKVSAGSFRGFGGTQVSYASESQIDMIARRLGIDPYEFRRRNFLGIGEPFQPGDSGMDVDLMAGLDAVAAKVGYHARARGTLKGCGLAVGLKDAGGTGNHAHAVVKVNLTGRTIVHAGTTEIGQGAMTAMCGIAAEELNIPLDWVDYGRIDTDHTPLNNGTHVSCGTTVTGTAVYRAVSAAREKIMAFAAEQLGCAPADLVLEPGWSVRKGNMSYPLEPMIQKFYGGCGYEFVGEGGIKVPNDPEAPLNARNMFWMVSWGAAEVEVDPETGLVTVTKLSIAGEVGKALDIQSCRGQIEGAAIQAYGQTLFEHMAYDGETPSNATPMKYRVPLVSDLPQQFAGLVLEHEMGPGPYKLKGIGESGMLAVAAAICNAVEDAIGVRVLEIPLTPERVLAAIDAKRAAEAIPGSAA